MTFDEQSPPPEWLGDVSAGVDAWTKRASSPGHPRVEEGRRPASTPPPEDTAAQVPEADAESVARKILLDRFEEVGLVDDDAFARSWIASRGATGGRALARRALAQELRRKGVADEVAREALDDVDPADEEAAARTLVRKRLRSLSRVDDTTATRRLVGMLARKGYGSGLAFAVVREELANAGRDSSFDD